VIERKQLDAVLADGPSCCSPVLLLDVSIGEIVAIKERNAAKRNMMCGP
jgi:hypothetical protein